MLTVIYTVIGKTHKYNLQKKLYLLKIKKIKTILGVIMQDYVCDLCGYVYKPADGDSSNNVPAGTEFEKLPDDWTCPLCGVDKSNFSPA